MSDIQKPDAGTAAEARLWIGRAMAQEGRAAATRGLLHDFSNVMVGLCSMSENVVDDVPEGEPLHDDLEIIRDSARRAQQLIRRLAQLNMGDPSEPDLVECRSWLEGELDSLRAVLPKGSDVGVAPDCPTAFIRAREDSLRDVLLVLCLGVARRHETRVHLVLGVTKVEAGLDLWMADSASDAGSPTRAGFGSTAQLPGDYVDRCAQQLGGTATETDEGGVHTVRLLIPLR